MSRHTPLILATLLALCWQPPVAGQTEGFLILENETQLSDLILTEPVGSTGNLAAKELLPVIHENRTITETTTSAERFLNLESTNDYANLLEDAKVDDLETLSKKKQGETARKDILTFMILSFVIDGVVTFIALALILHALGAHPTNTSLTVIAFVAAGISAAIGYYLKAVPPNPVGIGVSTLLVILSLSPLKTIPKLSTAVCGGLFAKIFAGLAAWLISLTADALF